MSKSCIITVTAGDFEYIEEWIEYHHNLGVDLFLIGYNGPSEKLYNYKTHDYVRYIDFSFNDTNLDNFRNGKFSAFNEYDIYNQTRMQKIENILYCYLKWMYQDIDYTIVIDTDEFIDIKDNDYNNVNKFLDDNFPIDKSNISLVMNFYTDNGHIYKTDEPCNERFVEALPAPEDDKCELPWYKKVIINMRHENSKDIILLSPHSCSYYQHIDLPEDRIALKHFFTKSLEEWVEKMIPSVDPDYYKRFNNEIFCKFFDFPCYNEITDEKIKAIPGLLEKYNIRYDMNLEPDSKFKKRYFEIFPEQKH